MQIGAKEQNFRKKKHNCSKLESAKKKRKDKAIADDQSASRNMKKKKKSQKSEGNQKTNDVKIFVPRREICGQDTKSLASHSYGINHIERLKKPNDEGTSAGLESHDGLISLKVKAEGNENINDGENVLQWICTICKVNCQSSKCFASHLSGKQHTKMQIGAKEQNFRKKKHTCSKLESAKKKQKDKAIADDQSASRNMKKKKKSQKAEGNQKTNDVKIFVPRREICCQEAKSLAPHSHGINHIERLKKPNDEGTSAGLESHDGLISLKVKAEGNENINGENVESAFAGLECHLESIKVNGNIKLTDLKVF
ncbi:hypothetical protein KP509_01G094900 [Ceratopteris richardii]|uniref:C2H2-type domain-containing protein n=1 Tax=Ceratopteris richardii TaxID=49495 RepID=A0A8T2VN61_CERRI|nr:hypothetical protein KP509_01G094900 [Ceratopteris richardii]